MIGAVPVQLPLLVVSVFPSSGVPEMTGGDWLPGAACGAASPISARPATTAATTSVPSSADQNNFEVRRMEDPFRLTFDVMA